MRLISLAITNFLSHEYTELDLESTGLLLLEGQNGAGKSTIPDALTWCLYGQTPRGLKGDDVVRKGHKPCEVVTTLEIRGQAYRIRRTRRPNSLQIFAGETDISLGTAKATQEKLLHLLGMDYRTFTNAVLFPQDAEGLASLTDSAKKEILDNVLGLDRFQEAQERAKAKQKELEEAYNAALKNLEAKRAEQNSQDRVIEDFKHKEKRWEQEKADTIRKIESALAALQNQPPSEQSDYSEEIESLRSELEETRKYNEDVWATRQEYLDRVAAIEEELRSRERWLSNTERELELLPSKIFQHPAPDGQNCPTCRQPLPDFKAYEAVREEEQERFNKAKAALDETLQDAQNLVEESRSKLQTAREAAERWQPKDTRTLEQKLKYLEDCQRDAAHNLKAHYAAIQKYQTQLDEASDEDNPWTDSLQEWEKSREETAQRLKTIELSLQPLQEELEVAKFWVEGFGNKGVKSLLLSSVLPFLNERASYYLSELADGQATVNISTTSTTKGGDTREKISIEVDYGSGVLDFQSKSGGEKARVSAALVLALGDLAATRASPVNLRIFDEAFGSLDSEGSAALCGLLRDYAEKVSSVLVITHNPDLASEFENRLTIRKENGTSRVHT